jgi:hypothetical protein
VIHFHEFGKLFRRRRDAPERGKETPTNCTLSSRVIAHDGDVDVAEAFAEREILGKHVLLFPSLIKKYLGIWFRSLISCKHVSFPASIS